MNLACSLLIVPGTVYWEQAQVSFLFRVNCSQNSKYGTDKKTCCSLYPVPETQEVHQTYLLQFCRLESELSFLRIGFCPINDVRARGWPPLENFLVTPMVTMLCFCLEFSALSEFSDGHLLENCLRGHTKVFLILFQFVLKVVFHVTFREICTAVIYC